MRYDKDYAFFALHFDWYYVDENGYQPTEKAPQEAVEAMKRFNKRMREEGIA